MTRLVPREVAAAQAGRHMARMNMRKRHAATSTLAVAVVLSVAIDSAAAQSTDWFETEGGDVRLVVAPPDAGAAQVRGIIDIRLAEGWHTYWRDPGSSGIPPYLDVSESFGIADAQLHFPAPVWVDNPYGDFAGYDAPVALPFTLDRTVDGRAKLVADVFLGICEEICIPVQNRFEMVIDNATGSTLDAMRVDQAHGALPGATADGLDVTIAADPPAGYAAITVSHESLGDEATPQIFVFATDGTLFKPPKIARSGATETRFLIEAIDQAKQERAVESWVTVRAGQTALEVRHAVTIAGTAE